MNSIKLIHLLTLSLAWKNMLFVATPGHVLGHFEGFKLPEDYEKLDPPAGHNGPFKDQPLKVQLIINIMDVTEINEMTNEISLELAIQRTWHEHRIEILQKLEEDSWYAIESVDAEKFWKPDFYVAGLRTFKIQRGITDLKHFTLRSDKHVMETLSVDLQVKCKFDFEIYPLDIQQCKLDFMSPMDPSEELYMEWDNSVEYPVSFTSEDEKEEIILSNFRLDLVLCKSNFLTKMRWGEVSTLRFWIIMHRDLRTHAMDTYVPTTMFVFMSWGSFLVKPEVVPGRMVLLVTNLLSLVTLFEATRSTAPPSHGVKCIDVWLLSCITFVFLALVEYALVLYQMHGKCPGTKTDKLRMFSPNIYPTDYTPQYYKRTPTERNVNRKHLKFLNPVLKVMSRCMICNRSHETWHIMDQVSLFIFPLLFGMYNIIYWVVFIAKQKAGKIPECL